MPVAAPMRQPATSSTRPILPPRALAALRSTAARATGASSACGPKPTMPLASPLMRRTQCLLPLNRASDSILNPPRRTRGGNEGRLASSMHPRHGAAQAHDVADDFGDRPVMFLGNFLIDLDG